MSKEKVKVINKGAPAGAYFLTFIGALVYFVQNSHGFDGFIVAILKAIVWPALLTHRVFELIKL